MRFGEECVGESGEIEGGIERKKERERKNG